MPKASNVPYAVQSSSRTCTWQAAGCGRFSRSPRKLEQDPDAVEDVKAFVDLVESTRSATSDQFKRIREASAEDVQGGQPLWKKSPCRYESSLILVDTCQ